MEAETDLEMMDEMNVMSIEDVENLCCEDDEDGDGAADQPDSAFLVLPFTAGKLLRLHQAGRQEKSHRLLDEPIEKEALVFIGAAEIRLR